MILDSRHDGGKKVTQSRLPNNFMRKSTKQAFVSVDHKSPVEKTVTSSRPKGSNKSLQLPRRQQHKASRKSTTRKEQDSRRKIGPKKKSGRKRNGIRVVILKKETPPKKYSPKLAAHERRIPVMIRTRNETGPAITVRKAASERTPRVHCREAPEGFPGSFICLHRGRLPASMLDAVRDDSYVIVTGTGSGAEKKLVYIQREGRPLTRDMLLNILNSNDIVRKSIAGETKSVESKPKLAKKKYVKPVTKIKRPPKPEGASARKSAAVKLSSDIIKTVQKPKPEINGTVQTSSSPQKRKSNEKHFSKNKHHVAKRPKLLKKSRKPAVVSKNKRTRPFPKKTVTLQIKLEVNEPQLPRKRSRKTKNKAVQVPVVAAADQRRQLTSKRKAAARIHHKKFNQTTSVGHRYRNIAKRRVRRSRADLQRQHGKAEAETVFVPAPLHVGAATATSDNVKRLSHVSHAVGKKPNFKLNIVSDEDSERQQTRFKEPGINARVSLTNGDLRELFDSLNHSPDGAASRQRHRHENIANSKPAITVSIHVGSLIARKGSLLSDERREQQSDRLLSRFARKRKKLSRKPSMRPVMDETGRVILTPHRQLVNEITHLLPRNFNGRLSRKYVHNLIRAFNPQTQKPSSLVKLFFLLYLTKKLEAAGDGSLLNSRNSLPLNIRRHLEKAKLLPTSDLSALEGLGRKEHVDLDLSGAENSVIRLKGERRENTWLVTQDRKQTGTGTGTVTGGRDSEEIHSSFPSKEKHGKFTSSNRKKQAYQMSADEVSKLGKAEHSESKNSNGLKSTERKKHPVADEETGSKALHAVLTRKKQVKASKPMNKMKAKQSLEGRLPKPQVEKSPKVKSRKNSTFVGKTITKSADKTGLSKQPKLNDNKQNKTMKLLNTVQAEQKNTNHSTEHNKPQKSGEEKVTKHKNKSSTAEPRNYQKSSDKKELTKRKNKNGMAKLSKLKKPGNKKPRKQVSNPKKPKKSAGKQAAKQRNQSKVRPPGRQGNAAKPAKHRPQPNKPKKPSSSLNDSRKPKARKNRNNAATMKSRVAAPSNDDDSNRLLRDASAFSVAYGSEAFVEKSAKVPANGSQGFQNIEKFQNYSLLAAGMMRDTRQRKVQSALEADAAKTRSTVYQTTRKPSLISLMHPFGTPFDQTASHDNLARQGLTSSLKAGLGTVKNRHDSDGSKVASSKTVHRPLRPGNIRSRSTMSTQNQNKSLKTNAKPFSSVKYKSQQIFNAKHIKGPAKAELNWEKPVRIEVRPISNHPAKEKEQHPTAVGYSSRLQATNSKPGPASQNKPGIKPQAQYHNTNSAFSRPFNMTQALRPSSSEPAGNETITSKLVKFVKGLFSSGKSDDSKPGAFAKNRSALSKNVNDVHISNQQRVNIKQPMISSASRFSAHPTKPLAFSAPLAFASSDASLFAKSVSVTPRGINSSLADLGPAVQQLVLVVSRTPQIGSSRDHFPKLVPVNWVIALNPSTATVPQEHRESKLIQLQELSEVVEHLPSEVDRCVVANPCRNFASCQTSAGGGVVCICRPGFSGPTCEMAVDPCRPNPCQNGAKCSASAPAVSNSDLAPSAGDNEATFSCQCPNGFSGRRCEVRLNPCDSRPCLNGGRCAVGDGDVASFRCICATSFEGPRCETTLWLTVSPASLTLTGCMSSGPDRCQNGGTCRLPMTDDVPPRCHCQVGFLGSRCEVRAVLCTVRSPCLNGATCLQVPGDGTTTPYFRCICPQRFKGRLCDKIRSLPIVGCNQKPCSSIDPLAVCKEIWEEGGGGPGFRCTCGPSYSGERCEVRGDPCGLVETGRSNPCRNYGVCLPLPGDGLYRCICSNHHVGRHCDVAVVRCGSLTCLNGGLCSSSNSSTVLISPSVHLSADNRGPEIETVTCHCPAGYTGRHCERHVEPCRSGPCLNGGLCRPADNREGFSCICAEPFFGRYCDSSPNQSSSGGSSRKLITKGGGTGRGQPLKQSKVETLIVDMRGDGDCVFSDYCLNGGSCFRTTAGRWVCVCLRGFGGDRCENGRDSCSSQPCLNGASCYNSPSGAYRCVCPTGFTGWRCDVGPEICAGSSPPCQNNGACRPARNTVGYECICPPGFGGLACELRDPCLDHPCRNGAECSILPSTDLRPKSDKSPSSSFQCRCPAGFSGQLCEVDGTANLDASQRTACSLVPCQSGATCRSSSSADGFVCVCPPGVKGKRCERDSKNDCRRSPCRNGGVCFDRPGGFECSCPDGFRGITCEVKLFSDPCDRRPCSNGGKCKVRMQVYFRHLQSLNVVVCHLVSFLRI
jgi:hypothetical protein